MIVNDKEYNIDNLLEDINFEKNKLKGVNKDLLLTNYQIAILKRNGINPENYSKISDIIYVAEEAFEETEDEELDIIISELSERNYYENTNK